jgi:hypothetical protein
MEAAGIFRHHNPKDNIQEHNVAGYGYKDGKYKQNAYQYDIDAEIIG